MEWKKTYTPKPARFFQSFRYNTGLWQTDGRTHDDSKLYRATIASIVSFNPRDAKLARVLDPVYVCLTPCQFSIEKVKRIGLGFSTYPTLCYKEI